MLSLPEKPVKRWSTQEKKPEVGSNNYYNIIILFTLIGGWWWVGKEAKDKAIEWNGTDCANQNSNTPLISTNSEKRIIKIHNLLDCSDQAIHTIAILHLVDMLHLSLQTHQKTSKRHINQTTHNNPTNLIDSHLSILLVLVFEHLAVHAVLVVVHQRLLEC